MPEISLCLGLMSGTSMDGIDAALIKTNSQEIVESVANAFFPYQPIFQQALKLSERLVQKFEGNLANANANFHQQTDEILNNEWHYGDRERQTFWNNLKNFLNALAIHQTNLTAIISASTLLHIQACQALIQQACIDKSSIEFIGYHGQTLFHAPAKKLTVQVGDAQALANHLQIPVVAQFRQNDVIHGGQGAPLAPIYHWALVQHHGLQPAAILNCGGIANITFVLHQNPERLLAFDCGPGNVLLDRLVRQRTQQQQMFDTDGQFALQGGIHESTLQELLTNSLPNGFLQQPPPKSLDSRDCQLPPGIDDLSLPDACATLAAFSAHCMADALNFSDIAPTRWILAGGGWHNPVILSQFKNYLQTKLGINLQVLTAKQVGWQQDALEAEAFAYLAKRSALNLPLSFPGTTGVQQPASGGIIYFPQPE